MYIQEKFVKANYKGPTKLVLVIRCASYQDLFTTYVHIHYYSKPNLIMLKIGRIRNIIILYKVCHLLLSLFEVRVSLRKLSSIN